MYDEPMVKIKCSKCGEIYTLGLLYYQAHVSGTVHLVCDCGSREFQEVKDKSILEISERQKNFKNIPKLNKGDKADLKIDLWKFNITKGKLI